MKLLDEIHIGAEEWRHNLQFYFKVVWGYQQGWRYKWKQSALFTCSMGKYNLERLLTQEKRNKNMMKRYVIMQGLDKFERTIFFWY